MGHAKLILFKTTVNLPVFFILYLVGGLDFVTSLVLSFLLIAISYLAGDLFILPRAGRFMALAADIGLTAGFLWLAREWGIPLSGKVIIYVVIAAAIAEGLMFHPYLKRLVSLDSMGPKIGKRS